MRNIKAVFRGSDGSRGFKTNYEYDLFVSHNINSNIKIESLYDYTLKCEYSSIITFLENWDMVRRSK